MSKRFGRNQKRRMREQIACLAQDVESAHGLLVQHRELLNQHEEFVRDVADAVGREAVVAGKPTFLEISGGKRDAFNMFARPKLSLGPCMGSISPDMATVELEVMRLLDVKVIRDSLSRQLHVRVQFDKGHVGYAMSERAIRNMPENELVRVIAPEIAQLLIRQIRG